MHLLIRFSTWTGTDRSTMQTVNVTVNVTDFVEEFSHKLQILKPHLFIAKQQLQFISQKKIDLRNEEVLVMFDFLENYLYIV